jgi:hypothetical protein
LERGIEKRRIAATNQIPIERFISICLKSSMVLNQNACLCKELIFSNWLMGVSPGLLLSALSLQLSAVLAFCFGL